MSKSSYGDLDKRTFLSSPIKVIVVDNKNESLAHIGEFLASYSFEGLEQRERLAGSLAPSLGARKADGAPLCGSRQAFSRRG
ncbi:hypothetical protein Tco_1307136 [Tanacetum coccineum]